MDPWIGEDTLLLNEPTSPIRNRLCVAAQVGRLEGLESEVDQLQNVLQGVATELESGHQHAQVSLLCTKQQAHQYSFFVLVSCIDDCKVAMVQIEANPWDSPGPRLGAADCFHSTCPAVQLTTAMTLHKTVLLSPACSRCVTAAVCNRKCNCKCSCDVLRCKLSELDPNDAQLIWSSLQSNAA